MTRQVGEKWGKASFEDEWMDGGYVQVPNAVMFDGAISAGAFRLYALLCWYAYRYHSAPKQTVLAAKIGVSDRSVRTYIQELELGDYLTVVQPGLGEPSRYVIHSLSRRKQASTPAGSDLPRSAEGEFRSYHIEQEPHTSQEHVALLAQLTAEERQRLEEDARALPQMEGKSEEFLQKVLPGLMVGLHQFREGQEEGSEQRTTSR